MQHHLDEFSVTDIRHTLHEVWRVISGRRWFFVFPCCLVATIAFLGSLWMPRTYTGHTVIKRENDPVFVSMMGKSWTHPYNEMREQTTQDLRDVEMIETVLAELGLPESVQTFQNGELTPESRRARQSLARAIAGSISARTLENTAYRDVISISLTLDDPAKIPPLLAGVRDAYLARAGKRTVRILEDVKAFFQQEAERSRGELEEIQKKMLAYELKYPGIDPNQPDRTRTEQAELVIESVEIDRKIEQLERSVAKSREKLAQVVDPTITINSSASEVLTMEPNPRWEEIRREIDRLRREIHDGKTVRFMTNAHPIIVRMQNQLAALEAEFASTPQECMVTGAGESAQHRARMAAVEQKRTLESRLADLNSEIAARRARREEIEDRTQLIERHRALAVEHRQDYMRLKADAERVDSELTGWARNVAPIQHVLTVEDRNRTIHLGVVQDVAAITRPDSPSARMVVLVCFGIGVAVGALVVLLAELMDRSFRSVKQLQSSLGVPVIEGIDEILTETSRKRQMIRNMFVMPAAAMLMIGVMLFSGTVAYMSIEDQGRYESMVSSPARVVNSLIGGG